MRAARLHAYGHALRLDEVEPSGPAAGQVVIKVGGAGFCHSDLHIFDDVYRRLKKGEIRGRAVIVPSEEQR